MLNIDDLINVGILSLLFPIQSSPNERTRISLIKTKLFFPQIDFLLSVSELPQSPNAIVENLNGLICRLK